MLGKTSNVWEKKFGQFFYLKNVIVIFCWYLPSTRRNWFCFDLISEKNWTLPNLLLHQPCNKESMSSTFYACVFLYKRSSQKAFAKLALVTFGFVILGVKILYEKHAQKTLMKLIPAINFINVKHTRFLYERHLAAFLPVTCLLKKLPKRRSYEKGALKMLMK